MNSFEKEVRKALIDKDWTISHLARELGVTNAYVYDILKGNRPAKKQKRRITKILGLKEA